MAEDTRSEAVTRGVRVVVQSQYVPQRSAPEQGQWFFAYRVRITNEGPETVQLVTRHWIITDGHGRTEHVRGPGVVGTEPVLECGQSFEYTSFCPLPTPVGTMHGSYGVVVDDGGRFDVQIAPFALSEPMAFN